MHLPGRISLQTFFRNLPPGFHFSIVHFSSLFPECVLRPAVARKVAREHSSQSPSGHASNWASSPCWPMNSGLTIQLLTARVLSSCVMNRLISFDFPATPTHPHLFLHLFLPHAHLHPRSQELCYNRDFFLR